MATEEQTTSDASTALRNNLYRRMGQRLTISNRSVTKLSFFLFRAGTVTGDVTFEIRAISGMSLLNSKVWGDASVIPTENSWIEAAFDTPVTINEEVFIGIHHEGGTLGNAIGFYISTSDVKANEYLYWHTDPGEDWAGNVNADAAYIYTYGANLSPNVSTLPCTDTTARSSTGQGRITNSGDTAITAHGHCWDTSIDPTTSNSYVDNEAAPNLGQFQSAITGLTPGTTYYVRAYATNTEGTGYGGNVTITTGTTIGKRYVWIEGKELHYFDEYEVERKIEGVPDASGLPWWYYTGY